MNFRHKCVIAVNSLHPRVPMYLMYLKYLVYLIYLMYLAVGTTLTDVEMKNCAAGEYVAIIQARRSNL